MKLYRIVGWFVVLLVSWGGSLAVARACTTNADCGAPTPFCDTGISTCVECLNSTQCDDGNPATTDVCAPAPSSSVKRCLHLEACTTDADCHLLDGDIVSFCQTSPRLCVHVTAKRCSTSAECGFPVPCAVANACFNEPVCPDISGAGGGAGAGADGSPFDKHCAYAADPTCLTRRPAPAMSRAALGAAALVLLAGGASLSRRRRMR